MKKVVLKLELHDDKSKQKAMKTVSGLSGVESVAMDVKDKKLTITGDIDPVKVVGKLRKLCRTEIVTVGPAKEPEKKKEEPKKEEPKKADEKKKDNNTNKDANNQAHLPLPPHMQPYYHHQAYYPPPPMQSYYNNHHQRSAEDDPNSCVIC